MLGGDALAVFPVGGLSGEMLTALLDCEHIAHRPVWITGITRESLAVFERQSGQQYRFILPGPSIAAHDRERCLDALITELAGASFLVASGSLPPGYRRISMPGLLRSLGLSFVLDTSGPALAGAGTGCFLIKTSLRELQQLVGAEFKTEAEEDRAARIVIAQGRAEVLVVSMGARGALLATATELRRFAAIPVAAAAALAPATAWSPALSCHCRAAGRWSRR